MGFPDSFKALSDNTRREILTLLRSGKLTAGEIGQHFDMTGATVSHHLSVLKKAGLVSDEKIGKYIYYELNASVIEEMLCWFLTLKGDHQDEKQ